MKNRFRDVITMLTAAALLLLVVLGCGSNFRTGNTEGDKAKERAEFAKNLDDSFRNDPPPRITVSISGANNEILVFQVPDATPARAEKLISSQSLATLRSKGFKKIEIRSSDGKVVSEKSVD